MLEVLVQLRDIRPVKSRELRSRIEAALMKAGGGLAGLSLVQFLILVALAWGQRYDLVPRHHWAFYAFAEFAYGCSIAAIVVLVLFLVWGLVTTRTRGYQAAILEAKHDHEQVTRKLLAFCKADLLASKAFLESKAAELQSKMSMFYGGGAVFLLALATGGWTVTKDVFGEKKLQEWTADHIIRGAPALVVYVFVMFLMIALFRALRSRWVYHVRLIDIALGLKERPQTEGKGRQSVRVTRNCLWCRLRRGILRCNCDVSANA